jgi:hypothetical protein
MRDIDRSRRCRETWHVSRVLALLVCAAAVSLAGTVTVELSLDTLTVLAPVSDTDEHAVPTGPYRVLVPIPRLCRVVSVNVICPGVKTTRAGLDDTSVDDDSPGQNRSGFTGETVEAGKAFAAFDVLQMRSDATGTATADSSFDLSITYEPLSAAERPLRESLLLATCGEQVDGIVLRTAERDCWYGGADTSSSQFFGGCPPEDFHFRELAYFPLNCDVVVAGIGGWGNVPFDRARDLAPTVLAMRESLLSWGRSVLVVPYPRVKGESFADRLAHQAEMSGLHHARSRVFAREIAELSGGAPALGWCSSVCPTVRRSSARRLTCSRRTSNPG